MRKNRAAVTMNLIGNLHGCGSFLFLESSIFCTNFPNQKTLIRKFSFSYNRYDFCFVFFSAKFTIEDRIGDTFD